MSDTKEYETDEQIADLLAKAGDAMVSARVRAKYNDDDERRAEVFGHLVAVRRAESSMRGVQAEATTI